jgi:ATP-dependent Clp protease, protease subunit
LLVPLGADTSAPANPKARYSYPFAKDSGSGTQLYRSGLVAIRQRSSAQNETAIYDAAGTLLDSVDGKGARAKIMKPAIILPRLRTARAFQSRMLMPDPDAPDEPYEPPGDPDETESPDAPDEISVMGEIGDWGMTAGMFADQLKNCTAPVLNLRLNSGGGSVFDGIQIYNLLVARPAQVVVNIGGWAASIASVVAMAGDQINIAENAQLMIHHAFSFCMGAADDLRKEAAVLDNIDASILGIYVARTGGDPKEIAAMVDAETWFSGQDAVDAGFADVCIPNKLAPKPAARMSAEFFDSVFHLPPELRSHLRRSSPAAAAPGSRSRPANRVDLERLLRRQAGLSKSEARRIVAGGWPALAGEDDPDATQLAPTIASATADLRKLRQR